MPDKILFACLCAAAFAVFILGIYIICATRKRSVFSDIYRSNVRDERFANSLLSAVFGNKVIKNPYIIRDDSGVSELPLSAYAAERANLLRPTADRGRSPTRSEQDRSPTS